MAQSGDNCKCTYPGCPRHANCSECIEYHNSMGEFPACMFSPEAEKTYDRSLDKLIEDRKH
ncbi:MAG: DUF6485 family protein [bacterium]